MKTTLFFALLLAAGFFVLSSAVQVKDGDDSFSLESVRVLQRLATLPQAGAENKLAAAEPSPRVAKTSYSALCAHPTLPQEFGPICQREGSSMRLARLSAVPMDVCEICAFVACTGC